MKKDFVVERMACLGIHEVDLEETFARSSGPGGQNVNKVATAVTLRHRPSGVSVTVQDSRSQAVNRKLARERLLDAIESARQERRAAEIAEREQRSIWINITKQILWGSNSDCDSQIAMILSLEIICSADFAEYLSNLRAAKKKNSPL